MVKMEKVGSVSIKRQERDGALYISYWSSIGKKIISRKVDGGIVAARKDAAVLNKQIKANKAPMTTMRIGIGEAMDEAIEHSRSRTTQHRANLADNARYFIDYISKAHPGLKYWEDVRYQHLKKYIDSLKARGISPRTAKHYASIVAMTSRHMARLDAKTYQRIEAYHPWLSTGETPVKRYLTPHDALDLLEMSKGRESINGHIAVALGAFAGLNLWEIARVQCKDVDLVSHTVVIRGSKNKHRNRTIPVLPMVIDALQGRMDGLVADEYLIKAKEGYMPTDRTISQNLHRRLLPAARKRYGRDFDISPKDLRKTLINILADACVVDQWAEAYVGHAAQSTMRRHYMDATVDKMRQHVLSPLQDFLIAIADTAHGKSRIKTMGEVVDLDDFMDDL